MIENQNEIESEFESEVEVEAEIGRRPGGIASALRTGLAASLLLASACSQRSQVSPAPPSSPTPAGSAPGAADRGDAPTPAGTALPIFRLPGDVRPTRQRVEMEVVPDRETFSGRVEIAIQLDRPREDLWISSRELTLSEGTLQTGGETLALAIEQDDARGVARLVPARRAAAGPATLKLAFHGAFNPRLVGLYRVKAEDRWYAYTQFEAVDARRAFPCFDEPAFKIPWEVVLTVPKSMVAVSNTPVVDESDAGEMKRLVFQPTRPLPSYLVALAVGDFDVVTPKPLPPNEVRSRPLQVRGIAPKGKGPALAHALKAGADLLVMLERWFGTEFPYPKLDHIAVPDFAYGAMENAGLITYREQVLLVDPQTASEAQKLAVAVVVAHEVAHQWYGDLVTMAWWDDLWLNESFAAVMETRIAAEWDPANRYDLVKLQAAHAAMATDELARVTPIRRELKVEGDIFGFDYQIAYDKGSRVIFMFEQFLGSEAFRAGIRQYLARHADGNATRDDLIAALSDQVGTDIQPALRSFVDRPGIPLVQATLLCDQGGPRVALKQSRHLPIGSAASRDALWAVPVCVRTEKKGKPDCMLLQKAEGELPLKRRSCPAWIALNPGGLGYYRWSLPPAQLRDLLTRGYRHLSPAERLSLGNNLSAGFRSAALPAADVLAALEPLARDPEPAVAQEPGVLLESVRDYFVEPSRRGEVESHMRALYGPVLARLGWKARAKEPARVSTFRAWVIGYLALTARDGAVLERAAALGRAFIGTDGRLHPDAVDRNLVPTALRAAARLGSAELFDVMLQRLIRETDSTVRDSLIGGLAAFTDPALAERARALSFDERLRVNERASVVFVHSETPELRSSAWAWVKKNFDTIAPRLPPSYVRELAYVQGGCSQEDASELEQALGRKLEPYAGGPYAMAKVIEYTRLCAAQVAAQRKSATEFFARKGRAGPAGAGRAVAPASP
jgi:cytosol alanyl aminopeptidase